MKRVIVNDTLVNRGPVEWPADKCEPARHVKLRGPLNGCACGLFSDDDPTGYHRRDLEFFQFVVTVGIPGDEMSFGGRAIGARNLVRELVRIAHIRDARIVSLVSSRPADIELDAQTKRERLAQANAIRREMAAAKAV